MDTPKKSRLKPKRRYSHPLTLPLLSVLRFVIFGVGLGAIAGTVLSKVDPPTLRTTTPIPEKPVTPALLSGKEILPLEQKLEALKTKYPKLQPGAIFLDLDNGNYVNWQGDTVFSAASTIKVPILVAFFQAVDAGKIKLDEPLTLEKDTLASGSGNIQYAGVGKKYTVLETARRMIVISDNSATNMLIKRLGGREFLNQRFQAWSLTNTLLYDVLPDLAGKNTTTPQDLAKIMERVNRGELLTGRSRDRFFMIMRQTETNTLLPQGLEKEAVIAHKTGDIRTVLGDVGLVDMPNGKQYIAAVLVKRLDNDPQAKSLIQEISRTAYQHLKWYEVKPKPPEVKPNATP
jgi:beta-lactamase class A